jgi:hypothetical protein
MRIKKIGTGKQILVTIRRYMIKHNNIQCNIVRIDKNKYSLDLTY